MRTKRTAVIAFGPALALLSLFATGCLSETAQPFPDEATGTLTVDLGAVSHKTFWPSQWANSIGTYEVEVVDVGGSVVASWGGDAPAGEIVFEGLLLGTYSVEARGFCAAGATNLCQVNVIIAQGEVEAEVIASNVDVTVEMRPLIGEEFGGRVTALLVWPTAQGVTRVEMEHKLFEAAEWSEPDAFDDEDWTTGGGVAALLLAQDKLVESGSHLLRLRLYRAEDVLVSTAIEVINVYGNFTTTALIELTASDFPEIGEPDFSVWLDDMAPGELQYVVTNWPPPIADPTTLYFPGSYAWTPANDATKLDFIAPRTSLFIDGTWAGNSFEFKVCTAFPPGDVPWDCWTFSDWLLRGVPVAYAPSLVEGKDNQQVLVPARAVDTILIVLDVGAKTLTAYVRPTPTGALTVTLSPSDPATDSAFALDCGRVDANLVCTHTGTFSTAAVYAWYLNGGRQAEPTAALTIPVAGLLPGHRVTLVVTDPPFAQSAQLTLTAAMLPAAP
jgi:hypothetical protein